ncbi:hypothetical protein V5N11_014067 [Cardamine amara subsp. amara]|uniref:Uncharacterized protein n=1 Tax=Cardamine amara subsp. amara TaxID=228776 RepID=A0ABD0ZN81_CARAN
MAQSLNLTSLLCFTFFILSFLLTQTQARNLQTITEPTDQNHRLSLPVNHHSMTSEEDEQEPAFVRETGHGYGLYGHQKSHTNNEEDENSDNDQFYYRSDAYGNRNGRFK